MRIFQEHKIWTFAKLTRLLFISYRFSLWCSFFINIDNLTFIGLKRMITFLFWWLIDVLVARFLELKIHIYLNTDIYNISDCIILVQVHLLLIFLILSFLFVTFTCLRVVVCVCMCVWVCVFVCVWIS